MGGADGFRSLAEGKANTVAKTKERLDDAMLIFAISGEGLTVAETQTLKESLPESTTAAVVKNRLMWRAASEYENFNAIEPMLEQSNMWFFVGEEDVKETLKKLNDFQKEFNKEETHAIRGGCMEGKMLTPAEVKAVAKIPTKKELIQRIAVNIKGVPQRIAKRINAVPTKTARAIKLANDEIHGSGDAPAEE